MKVVVISTPVFRICPPQGTVGYSGLESLAYFTAKGLAEKGHAISLVAPDKSECPGVEVIEIGPAGQVGEDHAWSGFNEIQHDGKVVRPAHPGYWQRLLDADAVVDHSWSKYSYLLKAEGRIKCPILGVLHAPIATMYQSLPPVEHPCMVCISDDQANRFYVQYNRRARVAKNGIDTEFYRNTGAPRSDRFLFLARFSSIKGPSIAIDVCNKLSLKLDLVGDTQITQEPQYLADCQAKCDGRRVRFVGPCSRSETVYWHSQAHVLLHPNKLFVEPLGLSPLESQACGTPVVAWRLGAMSETVKEGETGWLAESEAEYEEKVKEAVSGVSDAMRKRCREWVCDNFSLQRMIDRYDALIHEAVEKPW